MNKTDYVLNIFNKLLIEEIESNINVDELLALIFDSISKRQLITEEIKQVINLTKQLIFLLEENLKENNIISKISGNDIINCFENKNIFTRKSLPDIIVCKFDFSDFNSFKNFVINMTDELQLNEKQVYALSLLNIQLKSINRVIYKF